MKEMHTSPDHILLDAAAEALKMFLWTEIKVGKLDRVQARLVKQISPFIERRRYTEYKGHARLVSSSRPANAFLLQTSAEDSQQDESS